MYYKSLIVLFSLLLLCLGAFSQSWSMTHKLGSSDQVAADNLGFSVAISDSFMITGAWWEDGESDTTSFVNSAGAAYVFKREADGTWNQIQKLVAPDRGENDNFGKYVDLDDLGLVIGAHDATVGASNPESGSAYGAYCNDSLLIWGYENVSSSDLQKINIADPKAEEAFGWDIAVSGKWVVIGKSGEQRPPLGEMDLSTGAAYFFHWENGTWVEKQKVYPSHFRSSEEFGRAIGIDGTSCVIGAGAASTDADNSNIINGAGAAYVYELQNGTWTEVQKLVGTQRSSYDLYGESVDIFGEHIVVGAWLADSIPGVNMIDMGAVYLYKRDWPLAVAERLPVIGISLLSNPSSTGILSIHTDIYIGKLVSLELVSLAGQPLFSQTMKLEESWRHDFSALPAGIYLVQISGEGILPMVARWVKR